MKKRSKNEIKKFFSCLFDLYADVRELQSKIIIEMEPPHRLEYTFAQLQAVANFFGTDKFNFCNWSEEHEYSSYTSGTDHFLRFEILK
jgi:hypothetical protein